MFNAAFQMQGVFISRLQFDKAVVRAKFGLPGFVRRSVLTVSGNDIGGELCAVLHGVALLPQAVGSSKACCGCPGAKSRIRLLQFLLPVPARAAC